MEKNRNTFIDLITGIAIFLMLWGHCIQYCVAGSEIDFFENIVFKFIYSFHMPLFMLVSGYLFFFSFSKRSLKELLIHRVQSLLQPIVFCSFFNHLIRAFNLAHITATSALVAFALGLKFSAYIRELFFPKIC